MEELSYVLTQYVHVRFYFSLPLIFTCWPLAFLIFSPPPWISMFLFLRKSSPLFAITRSSSCSVIHVSLNIKDNTERDTTLLFFLCEFPGGHVVSFQIKLTLSCIWVAIPVDWVTLHWYVCGAEGRSLARSLARCTVTWLPNFLGWVDYLISLAMGLRPRAALRY